MRGRDPALTIRGLRVAMKRSVARCKLCTAARLEKQRVKVKRTYQIMVRMASFEGTNVTLIKRVSTSTSDHLYIGGAWCAESAPGF